MDELLDILDTDGNPNGTKEMKSKAHRFGLFHATAHIWFYTTSRQLLIQQRGKYKDTYPLLWDVSVAGHIGAGEEIKVSAIREIEEEIGLTVQSEDLEKIGIFKSEQKHNKNLMDNEFHHTFLCILKVPLQKLIKQESEVEALDLVPLRYFEKAVLLNKTVQKFVPHRLAYYQAVIKAIKERL
ncbi:MAG: isopentenyl-diphosphate delta-isomerase [Maribacter sp.]|jgi:isopentenyldiphosphate isomerase